MNIDEEQKLIKLRKPHLIVKQNIYKSFWKSIVYIFTVSCGYLYTCVLTIKITEKCFYIGLKCWSRSVCLKEEHGMHIESSIILQSCIIWIASTLFCLSIHNKHFLTHDAYECFLLLFESETNLPLLFNAVVLKRIWLWILIMTNKYSWQNWDQRRRSQNHQTEN